MGNMQNGVILHIASVAYTNVVHVAPNNGTGPDRHIVAQYDITNDCRAVINEHALPQLGSDTIKRSN
jgi:hypothetical protein